MDARHFDRLVSVWSNSGSRRTLVVLLTSLPLLGVLASLPGLDDQVDARGRRKRHKKQHHHRKKTGNRAGKRQKRRCKPDSRARTCDRTCGLVVNNCKKTLDCGSCDCPEPCGACFVCQSGSNGPGACVVDPAQQRDPCGEPGQVCQADGTCACDSGSCPPCAICQDDGACAAFCNGTGCCDHGTCTEGLNNSTCGRNGDDCAPCAAPETCGGGSPSTPGVCGCTPTTCAAEGKNCGTIPDGCGNTLNCPAGPEPGTCGAPTPACIGSVCTACGPDNAGASCTPIDGGTSEATCQPDGKCCVPSGEFAGTDCSSANCCSGCCHFPTGNCC
jgi:hypothetical protein